MEKKYTFWTKTKGTFILIDNSFSSIEEAKSFISSTLNSQKIEFIENFNKAKTVVYIRCEEVAYRITLNKGDNILTAGSCQWKYDRDSNDIVNVSFIKYSSLTDI